MQWANRSLHEIYNDLLELAENRAAAVILYHERIPLAACRDELHALDHKTPEQVQKQAPHSEHTQYL